MSSIKNDTKYILLYIYYIGFIEIRNCAFCLTQFSYSERNLKKLVENYHAWKDRINTPQVMERFKEILVKVKRQARAETKSLGESNFIISSSSRL